MVQTLGCAPYSSLAFFARTVHEDIGLPGLTPGGRPAARTQALLEGLVKLTANEPALQFWDAASELNDARKGEDADRSGL
jgi:hypothetical protein